MRLIGPRHEKTCFFCHMRTTKAQISMHIRCFYIQNFKPLSSFYGFCGCTGRFESTLVANPEDRFFSWRGSITVWATSWQNLLLLYANNKGASAQSDQCLCCSLLRWYNTSTCYSRNFKALASLCSCVGWFVSYLVENPTGRQVFSWRGSYDSPVVVQTVQTASIQKPLGRAANRS